MVCGDGGGCDDEGRESGDSSEGIDGENVGEQDVNAIRVRQASR